MTDIRCKQLACEFGQLFPVVRSYCKTRNDLLGMAVCGLVLQHNRF